MVQHPRIQPASQKELQFFSLHYQRGWNWYQQQFPQQRRLWKLCLSGEATPYYLFHPVAAERIARHCPKARLVVLLRDPVERALSQYFHSVRLGLEDLPLKEALATEAERLTGAEAVLARGEVHRSHQEHSYVSRSRYGHQLDRYARLFPANQLLVLRSERFFADPVSTTETVWRFLGLRPEPLQQVQIRNQGQGEASDVPHEIRETLERTLSGEREVMNQWLQRNGPR